MPVILNPGHRIPHRVSDLALFNPNFLNLHLSTAHVNKNYHINDALFKPAVHHESFEKLWETKWKAPCSMGIYPFMFGCIQDFEPIAQAIIEKGLKEPYNWDEYAQMFFPKAQELARIAEEAEKSGQKEKASEYYLRSSAVYRIARFPAPRSEQQRLAWSNGKSAFYKGAALLSTPIHQVRIPYTHAAGPHEASSSSSYIPANFQLPTTTSPPPRRGLPLLVILTGLDGYRTELAVWQPVFAQKSCATLVLEIPGTGDSPADPSDPTSPDRVLSSVLDWVDSHPQLDSKRVIVWGFSTGGYYSLRAAHTHSHRLLGAVSLGGGCHRMFDRTWLRHVNKLEYPFDLCDTLAYKFGYGTDVENFTQEGQRRFSLVEDGTLNKACCSTLVVNGNLDEIFPVEDLYFALGRSDGEMKKDGPVVRIEGKKNVVGYVVAGKKHMGEPESFGVILSWVHELFGLDGRVEDHLRGLPSRMKY
ncbi:Alpha/Beta hydrolase protein [Cladorrhinum sp. PSN332]|nr:Alpha/Beta hydrolase protein [Cladorrhinum sp. PSN332]